MGVNKSFPIIRDFVKSLIKRKIPVWCQRDANPNDAAENRCIINLVRVQFWRNITINANTVEISSPS